MEQELRIWKMRWPVPLCAGAVWLLFGAWILWAASRDGVLTMPATGDPPGIALWRHYGFLASFVAAPIVVGLTWLAGKYFQELVHSLIDRQGTEPDKSAVLALVRPHLDSLRLGNRTGWAFWTLVAAILVVAGLEAFIFSRFENHLYNSRDVFNGRRTRTPSWPRTAIWSSFGPPFILSPCSI